jgi:hypothetical protein
MAAQREVDPRFDSTIHPEFKEPPFIPMPVAAARESEGLVWWRPDGVISATPDNDSVVVRGG